MVQSMKKRFYDKRVVHDSGHLLSQDGRYGIYCLPVIAIEIARKYWANPAMWLSSYSARVTDDKTYETPSLVDFDVIQEALDIALEETNTMPLCDDLIAILGEINQSIQAIQLTCNSTCGGGGGCGGGVTIGEGSEQATQDNVDEGEPPNSNFEVTIDINRCNRVNGLIDWIISSIEEFDNQGIIGLINFGFQFSISVITAVYFKTIIGSWMTTRLGYISNIANFLSVNINLEGIVTFLETNKQELVCAWYSGDNGDVVINAFSDIAIREGLPLVDRAFLLSMITYDFISIGWFDVMDDPILNNELNNFSGGLPCDTCQQPNNWDFTISDAEWTIVENESTNGFWDDGVGFKGSAIGVTESFIGIVSDVELSLGYMDIKLQGSGNGITRCNISTSTEKDGAFVLIGYAEFITTYDPPEFIRIDNLAIVDKFVKVNVGRFENNPFCVIAEITVG